jgi:hypothetical protein
VYKGNWAALSGEAEHLAKAALKQAIAVGAHSSVVAALAPANGPFGMSATTALIMFQHLAEWCSENRGKKVARSGECRGRRGRPADSDAEEAKRIYDAWQTGHYRTYQALANVLHLSQTKVKAAIGRARKRVKPKSE